MAQTRELRRRIKSVASTRKITKAMELVAAAKMRRASQAALATRSYALAAWNLLTNLSRVTDHEAHPLLRSNHSGRRAVVIVTSDRGLVGGLNAQLLRATLAAFPASERKAIDVISIGRRGEAGLRRAGFTLTAAFTDLTTSPSLAALRPVTQLAIGGYERGQYDRVDLVYSDYVSVLTQKPVVRPLLPISRDVLATLIRGAVGSVDQASPPASVEYLFEPNPEAVLRSVLRGLVEMQLYQALLEANASEHAARMVAMRNASDAASDLIDELTLEFNSARQAGITKDLAEITASRASLEA